MNCEQLEDYLCRLLDPSQAQKFESEHVAHCEECQLAIHAEQRLFYTLKTAVEELEPCPVRLMVLPRPVPSSKPRRSGFAMVSSAIALAAMIACLLFATNTSSPPETETVAIGPGPTVSPPTVQLPDDIIGVKLESGDPTVTIVMLYETTSRTQQQPVDFPQYPLASTQ